MLAAALGVVALVTLGVAKNPADTLQDLAAAASGDSLGAIAGRLAN